MDVEGLLRLLVGAVAALVLLALFAGAWAVRLRFRNDAVRRRWEALEQRWVPRILGALADPSEIDRITADLPPEDRLPFLQVLLRFARRLSGEERDTLERAALPHLHLLVERARAPRTEERARAIQTLGELALDEHRPIVEGALRDPAPVVRLAAAQGLARGGTARDAEVLLGALDAFTGWRRGFLSALLAEVGAEGVPAMVRAMSDPDRPPDQRAVAAAALARLRAPQALPAARRVVESESDPDLVVAALTLLGEVGEPSALPLVASRIGDPAEPIRGAALEALARLAPDAGRSGDLLQGLSDPSAFVALRTARGLLRSGDLDLLRNAALRGGRAAQVARLALEVGE